MTFLSLALLALGAGAGHPPSSGSTEEFDGVIRMGGSSTLLPILAECANAFMETHHTWDKVDPSFPSVPILIFVTGGGSGFGVKATTSGAVDIGLSTRNLKDEEKTAIGAHQTFLVGKDCLAVTTSKASPYAHAASMSQAEAVRVLAGECKTWKELDPSLPERPIVLLIRDMAGSANELLQSKVLEKKAFRADALQLPSMGAILKRLEENPNAFAFLSSGMAYASDKLQVHAFEGVAPTNANVLAGTYPLTRPMLLLVKGEPSRYQKAFIEFVLGPGQKTVEAHGYVPVKPVKAQ